MSRTVRLGVFLVGGAGVVVLAVLAVIGIPSFGNSFHPYRTAAVNESVARVSANVVSSINFDQRGLDTLGEETILLASVIGVATLLRPADDETEARPLAEGRVLESTKLFGYIMLPITLVIGLDVISHGQLTPGGGFQGGVVVGTGIHLLYVAGSYPALKRARPVRAFEWGEAIGAGAFACLGVVGIFVAGSFLANMIPLGRFGNLFSAGTVPLLSGVVGVEVASGTAVLLAKFLDQAIMVKGDDTEAEGESR